MFVPVRVFARVNVNMMYWAGKGEGGGGVCYGLYNKNL